MKKNNLNNDIIIYSEIDAKEYINPNSLDASIFEILNNALDEQYASKTKHVDVYVEGNYLCIQDYGRGLRSLDLDNRIPKDTPSKSKLSKGCIFGLNAAIANLYAANAMIIIDSSYLKISIIENTPSFPLIVNVLDPTIKEGTLIKIGNLSDKVIEDFFYNLISRGEADYSGINIDYQKNLYGKAVGAPKPSVKVSFADEKYER